jgi:uncharacterized small protein (DUF1192 family)
MRIHEITKDIEIPAKVGNLDGFQERAAILTKEFEAFKAEYTKV